MSTYRLYVNEERTVLVRIWPNGSVEASFRATSDHIWGPPIPLVDDSPADEPEDREPSDDQLYNRHGMEGGIPYSTTDTRDEHDPSL